MTVTLNLERCRYCGKFVRQGSQITTGVEWQTLCQKCYTASQEGLRPSALPA